MKKKAFALGVNKAKTIDSWWEHNHGDQSGSSKAQYYSQRLEMKEKIAKCKEKIDTKKAEIYVNSNKTG